MNCKRCEGSITKKTRRVVITDARGVNPQLVYCRHCYKATTGKKRMEDCFEYQIIKR